MNKLARIFVYALLLSLAAAATSAGSGRCRLTTSTLNSAT